jgi:hypothetical protein
MIESIFMVNCSDMEQADFILATGTDETLGVDFVDPFIGSTDLFVMIDASVTVTDRQ